MSSQMRYCFHTTLIQLSIQRAHDKEFVIFAFYCADALSSAAALSTPTCDSLLFLVEIELPKEMFDSWETFVIAKVEFLVDLWIGW
jgi:hypothetical protein